MTIIAEIGQNHCGDMELAKKLILLAKINGADLVKFQLYDSRKLYGEYQPTELNFYQAQMLFNYGLACDIEVFFSVFDVERVKWCEGIGVKRYKIASQSYELVKWDIPSQTLLIPDFIKLVLNTKRPVIISGSLHIGVRAKSLYCIPHYPTTIEELQFTDGMFEDEACGEYPKAYDGFSDHTIGLDAAKIALARGAEIIEKHFAIDHSTGVDAEWSMTPSELKELKRWEGVCREAIGT